MPASLIEPRQQDRSPRNDGGTTKAGVPILGVTTGRDRTH